MPPNMQVIDDVDWFEEIPIPRPAPPRRGPVVFDRAKMFAKMYGASIMPGRSSIADKERNSKMRISFTLEIPDECLTPKALKLMKPQAVMALHSLMQSAKEAGAKGKLLPAAADPLLDNVYFSIEVRGLVDACANINPVFEAAREAAVKEAGNDDG